MENLPYYLTFSYFLGIGPYKFDLLIEKFQDVKTAFQADERELIGPLTEECAAKFSRFKKNFNPFYALDYIRSKNITILCREDSLYPEHLKHIPDAPICLYLKGNSDILTFPQEQYIAVVGTRKPSPYGLQIAKEYTTVFAQNDKVVVSGMALGTDGQAHNAALEAGGKTIAVLAAGVSRAYPSEHRYIYEAILKNGGAIISEFQPGQYALPGLFVARNRIISGLSKGVLVTEGKKDSGSLSTGRYGIEQGRDVFCIPGSPTNELSETPNILIKEGAHLVTDVSDILFRYNIRFTSKKRKPRVLELSEDQLIIFSKLLKKPLSADEVSDSISKPIYLTLSDLSRLEILGEVERNSEGKYQLR